MAMTLEELLAGEGFKRRQSKISTGASLVFPVASAPNSTDQERKISGSFSDVRNTERTKSDLSRYRFRDVLPSSDSTNGIRPRYNPSPRDKLDREAREQGEGDSTDFYHINNRSRCDSAEDYPVNEIVEVGEEDGEGYQDLFSNKMCSPYIRNGKFSAGSTEREIPRQGSGKDIEVDNTFGNSSNKHPLRRVSYRDYYGISDKSYHFSGSFDDGISQRLAESEPALDEVQNVPEPAVNVPVPEPAIGEVQNVSEPALDDIAVKALISIVCGYIRLFPNDDDFRTSLHRNSFMVLSFTESAEGIFSESKVMASLEQAIETVEGAAEECVSGKELIKASLQLRLITGLSSDDLKGGFTSGIPNSKISACAHLYLSVIYILQKKDRIAAKHLLQVFCDSPFEARTMLLPDLWDRMFLPHLSHLKVWYNEEADYLANTPSNSRELKTIEKVYNEIMDSGTYQFAVYYKDWLTEGVEGPSTPSMHVPSVPDHGARRGGPQSYSVERIRQEGNFSRSIDKQSPTEPYSPLPMVSKRLYAAVFGRSLKSRVNNMTEYKPVQGFDSGTGSSGGSTVEGEQELTRSFGKVKHMDKNIGRDNSSHHEDGLYAEAAWRLRRASAPSTDAIDKFREYPGNRESTQVSPVYPETKVNEFACKRLARLAFKLQETDWSIELTSTTSSSHTEDAPYPYFSANSIKTRSSDEGFHGGFDNANEESYFSNIPEVFICPLTGLVFKDPVTLETGQTFERAAISEWFRQGNKECPVTGKTLECQSVPESNFILKRVIESWKSDHCNHLSAFASQAAGDNNPELKVARLALLEQLLTTSSNEDRITNAKLLLSLGGLQFLVRRFEFGNMEAKTHVAALLSSCIEAESSCRDYIARTIKKPCLLELIHSKQVRSRTMAVSLSIELICLNRRKDVNLFLRGLLSDGILDTMHVLLLHLRSSPPEERPLVAVLLLHFDLLVEPRKYSMYREEAVDAIAAALGGSLYDKKIRSKICKALLILGGCFSSSGKITTEDWILRQTGFLDGSDPNSLEYEENNRIVADENHCSDDDYEREEWLRRLSASLVADGKRSFLGSISKCLGSGNLDLVRVCLTTVAWLSSALASLPDTKFQLSAFSAVISRLKEVLENDEQVRHRILANQSLLNLSNIPECRVLLMAIAEELIVPLQSLAEVTWMAGELYAVISGDVS